MIDGVLVMLVDEIEEITGIVTPVVGITGMLKGVIGDGEEIPPVV